MASAVMKQAHEEGVATWEKAIAAIEKDKNAFGYDHDDDASEDSQVRLCHARASSSLIDTCGGASRDEGGQAGMSAQHRHTSAATQAGRTGALSPSTFPAVCLSVFAISL